MSKKHLLVRKPSLFSDLGTACGIVIKRWHDGGFRNGSIGYAQDDLKEIGFPLVDDEHEVTCLNCLRRTQNGQFRFSTVPLL